VGAALGLAGDALGIAVAELAAMSERRIDRLVNPLVSGLPAFLAADSGAGSGFMIAQYTAVSLASENRRRAAPASLDGESPRPAGRSPRARHPAALKLVADRSRTPKPSSRSSYWRRFRPYDLAHDAPARPERSRPMRYIGGCAGS